MDMTALEIFLYYMATMIFLTGLCYNGSNE